jgi:predicted TIM-barrel fold metal-dependent hydrolase
MTTMRIVDAHHHLWDLDKIYYPWLSDRIRAVVFGDYARIRQNYLLADFAKDIGGLNVVKSVHIQADCDELQAVDETRWLQSVADEPNAPGFPQAIIAFADLSKPTAASVLDAHLRSANVRGIRQMLHHVRTNDPTVSSTEYLRHPVWLANLRLLVERGLSYDLQLFPEQMLDAARVVAANPDLQFILCHTGSPRLRDAAGMQVWRDGMKALARQANVAVKISGLGMYDRTWSIETIRPFVEEVILLFGADRCMFGSNFPVDSIMSSYAAVWNAFDTITEALGAEHRAKLFATNAERYYRI